MVRDKSAQTPEKEKKKKKEKAVVAKTNIQPTKPVPTQAPAKHLRSRGGDKKTESPEPESPDPTTSIQKIPTPPKLSPEVDKQTEDEDTGIEIVQTQSIIDKQGGIRTPSPDDFKEKTRKDKLAMDKDILLTHQKDWMRLGPRKGPNKRTPEKWEAHIRKLAKEKQNAEEEDARERAKQQEEREEED